VKQTVSQHDLLGFPVALGMKRARTPFKREPSSLTARTYAHVITLEGEDKYVLRYYIRYERERGPRHLAD